MARLIFAGVLAAAAAPLFAQPVPPAPPLAAPVIAVAPRAPMAVMTRADVQARVQAQFARRDANRDGFLTADEIKVRGGRRTERNVIVRRMGEGGPNAMGRGLGDANAAFDRLDANHDGAITRDEFGRARQVRIEKRVVLNEQGQPGQWQRRGLPGQPGAVRIIRHGGGGGMLGAALLQRADANRDGRVSLAEATGAALQHFDMIDANRDGRITPEERAAGRARMMQMHKAG